MSAESKRGLILASIGFAYFVAFTAVLAPIREVLSLTTTVSPWVYGVVVSGVIAWALVRCLGRSRDATAR